MLHPNIRQMLHPICGLPHASKSESQRFLLSPNFLAEKSCFFGLILTKSIWFKMAKVQFRYDQFCHVQWSPKPSPYACLLLLGGSKSHLIPLEFWKVLNELVKNWKQGSIRLSPKL